MVLGGGGDNLHGKFTGADKLGREGLGIYTLVVVMERVSPEIQAFSPLMYLDILKLVVFKNTVNKQNCSENYTPLAEQIKLQVWYYYLARVHGASLCREIVQSSPC